MSRGETGADDGETEPRGKGKLCSRCGQPLVGSERIMLDQYSYDPKLMGSDWTWRHERCPETPTGSVDGENV
jgi:hypothetical protein